MRRLPPLSALPAFEATARLGSVTAAAAELGRTHSAVSKQVTNLSDDLGGALFEKSGNGLKLTPRGERLRAALTSMLDDLDALSRTLRNEVDERQVEILLSATLATRWLIPRLPQFYAVHPGIEIRLRMSGLVWVPDSQVDVMLSYDRLRNPIPAQPGVALGDTAYGPVCTPDYPMRKVGNRWTAPTSLTYAGAHRSWQEWAQRAGVDFSAEQDVEHPHHMIALEAAAAGLGVALAEHRLVKQDMAAGRLIAPLGFVVAPGGFQATIMPHASDRKAVKVFVDWLVGEAAEAPLLAQPHPSLVSVAIAI